MGTKKNVVVIGSGFAGLSAAALLAQQGHNVTLLEKNSQAGGRARTWQQNGFTFDMGPSWYWMPEVFEQYYNLFGNTASNFYQLQRLDPSYKIFYPNQDIDVPASYTELIALFEKNEQGSGEKLEEFLADARYKYETAMSDFVFRVSDSVTEFLDLNLLVQAFKLKLFSSIRSEVREKFKNPALVSLLEFPVLFLGSTPSNTPAMYSMMNYADLVLGTWYPMGGMHKIAEAFVTIAKQQGVKLILNCEVKRIEVDGKGLAKLVHTNLGTYPADIVVAGSDYHHTEQQLLDKPYRQYSEQYWNKRTMSPSSLLYYIGINKRLPNLLHHNLFFDADFEQHANEIYDTPRWPSNPLFYACVPSITDATVAPQGMENLFLLMPLAPGLPDSEQIREDYFNKMITRLEAKTGEHIRNNIVVKRSYCVSDFERDYNSYKGNAYGLANTLAQTAILKPKMISAKVKNLFYVGQLTVPGPGMPPAIISGRIAAAEIAKRISKNQL